MALTSKDSIIGTNHGQHRTKYDFEEVVADIIDNSIDANATEINIEFKDTDYTAAGSPGGQGKSVKYKEGLGFLTGKRSYLLISDNGKGMTFDELHENLTRGSIREYEDYELGHFGIGLKDATLSQAYEVTVFSKKKGHPVAALRMSSIWYQETGKNEFMEPSKDFINQYEWMGKTDGYRKSVNLLTGAESGTIVLLEGLHKQEKKYGNSMSRSDYNTSIINLLDAHLGIVFERYLDKKTPHKIARSDGSEMDVPDISIKINNMSVFPLDPFYNAFRDNTNNRWTLTRSFTTESVFDKDGPNEKTINVKSSMHIVPQVEDIKTNKSAKSLYSRMQRLGNYTDLQGIYVYRHQRLLDYGGWKGIGKKSSSSVVGRWEVHLPAHTADDLVKLNFVIDKGKKDVEIGEITVENLSKHWAEQQSSKKYLWHPLDYQTTNITNRLKQRTNRTEKEPMELKCVDCSSFGHGSYSSKKGSTCTFTPTPTPGGAGGASGTGSTGGIGGTGGTGGVGGTGGTGGSGGAGGAGGAGGTGGPPSITYTVKSATTGSQLVKVSASNVEVNKNHPAYADLKKWFDSQ